MDVLNISLDDNEADTSHDELDEDPDFSIVFTPPSPANRNYINREVTSTGEMTKLFKEWERPALEEGTLLYQCSPLEPQPNQFSFMFLDSVSSVSKYKHPSINLNNIVMKMPLHTVMRLFGVARVGGVPSPSHDSQELFCDPNSADCKSFKTTHSVSVCCNVHGFIPHFYALPTQEFFENEQFFTMIEKIQNDLNEKSIAEIFKNLNLVSVHDFINENNKPVIHIEGIKLSQVENKIYHFSSNRDRSKESLVLKIYVALPMFISQVAKVLNNILDPCEFQPFETAITNNIRFLADQNLPGCTWIATKAGKYFQRVGADKESYCQIELDVHYDDVIKLEIQPREIPQLRILSFDIETRVCSERTEAQIIQVGAVLSTYGVPGDQTIGKAIFTLGSCEPLPDAKVFQFYDKENPEDVDEKNLAESEMAMLTSFRDFVVQMDPDIVTGYNIKNFDLPHILRRADKYFTNSDDIKRFPYLGRLKKVKTSIRPIINKNKQMYWFDKYMINIQGRIIMDMFPLFLRHGGPQSTKNPYKLKAVAKRHLPTGEEKDDVDYSEINGLQNGNSTTRQRLAKYCVQDAYLPTKLMLINVPDQKINPRDFIQHYFEKSRLGGTIIRYLVNKSKEFDKYFKQVRVQKNDGRVQYHPDSPSPKKVLSKLSDPEKLDLKPQKLSRILFRD